MSDEYIEILISILQKVLRDRRKYSSDPDFIKFNQSELISKKYLKSIASISLNNFEKNKLNLKDGGTTHFCVWDKNNNIVSATQSIGYQFGCGEIAINLLISGLRINNCIAISEPKEKPDTQH